MDSKLRNLINDCTRSLKEAATDNKHPWRLFTAANTDIGGNPQSRYVVFRQFEEESKSVVFFTDQRSTKVPALKRNSRISLCFFDPLAKLQLEVKATVQVHNNNDTAKKYWENTPWYSLQCYYMKESPGEALEAPFLLKANKMNEAEAYRYFAVVECKSIAWDILLLTEEGNQRASCTFRKDGDISAATWIAP